MHRLVIVGNGGFAKEVKWLVERINEVQYIWDFIGFIDNNTNDIHVIGDDEYILNCDSELYVAIAIGDPDIRKRLYYQYKCNSNVRFPNLTDPSVISSERLFCGEGNIVCAGTIMTVDIEIGNCNIINLDCTIGHDVQIKDFVTINPSVNISGNVSIKSGCNIGTGTQIIQGIDVGQNTIIGAGAVVNRSIVGNCTVVGAPARRVC